MKCLHCGVYARLPGGGVYCRICTLAGRIHQQEATGQHPWWEWEPYRDLDWNEYLSALIVALGGETESPIALTCRPARGAWLPPAAIRILKEIP